MATAAPHVKLLRQLASAKDDYLSGAFDISWDGAKATLYLVFGRPSHAVFDTDQAQIEGEAAIDALLAELPRTFVVSDWRRAMSPQETLSISIDELAGPFVRLAGSYADDPVTEENPEWWTADDSSPDLAFGLTDFPLLPGGRPLWAETSPENVNLAERLADLPPSILILTGAKLRAAAVVSGGDLIDAVWIDDEDQARGEAAGMALLGATKGSLAGYALDDPRVAEALTMLWRLPLAVSGIELAWLDPASMLAAFRADGLDRVLVIDAPVRGIALFSRGGLVAVYSETQRSAVASPERLRSLLSQARGRLTVMERKPRPVGAAVAQAAPSATDFFGVVAPEAPAEAAPETPTDDVSEAAAEDVSEATAAVGPEAAVEADGAVAADADTATETGSNADEAPTADAETASAVEVEAAPAADAEAGPADDAEAAPAAEPSAPSWLVWPLADHESPAAAEAPALEPAAEGETASTAEAEHTVEAVTPGVAAEADDAATSADASELPPPPPPDAEHAAASDADLAAIAEHAPPSDADVAVTAEHAPPPPAPEAAAEPEQKTKRRWFSFGGRKNKSAASSAPTAEPAAAEAPPAPESGDAATFSGWSVRQPNPEPLPIWQRSRDPADGTDDAPDGAAPPPPDSDVPTAEAEAPAAAATWSIVDPSAVAHEATTPAPEDASEVDISEATSQPETAASQGWSARDAGDSGGWHRPAKAVPAESTDEAAADGAPAGASLDEPDAASPHEHDATGGGDHDEPETGAETEHTPADHEAEPSEHPLFAAADDETTPADGAEHAAATTGDEPEGAEEHAAATDAGPAHDFWAEFATPEPDADTAAPDAAAATDPDPAPAETTSEAAHADSEEEPAAAEHPDHLPRRSSERTLAPWSWPLAEDESAVAGGSRSRSAAPAEQTPTPAAASAQHASEPGASESDDWAPVFEGAGEPGFFHRDEPVGSQFVDFDEVRTELVQIGVIWLGEANAVPVTALLRKTRSTIDDFVATIDTIRGLHLEGQDPASIQAMAREMHQQAAERLCGA
jgi:hypothetical protein